MNLFVSFILRAISVFIKDWVLYEEQDSNHCSVSTVSGGRTREEGRPRGRSPDLTSQRGKGGRDPTGQMQDLSFPIRPRWNAKQ